MKIAARKHDLIALAISDPREKQLPREGLFILKDHETGDEFMADFSSRETQLRFAEDLREREERLTTLFKKYHVDFIAISDERNYEKPLFDFFLERKRKFTR